MAHSITIKLQQPAREFAAGESVGFGIRGGVRYYDRKAQKNEFTNYQAVIFAKEGAQAEFYRSALTAGAIVEVSGDNIKVNTFDGQNGLQVTLDILNARLGFIASGSDESPAQRKPATKPTTQSSPPMDFDDDITF